MHKKIDWNGVFARALNSVLVLSVVAMPSSATASDAGGDASAPSNLLKSKARKAFVEQLNNPESKMNIGLSYWIELTRDNKAYRSNNKYKYKSGDLIRFHIVANTDGFVYLVMKKGTSGAQTLLFPSKETGMNNEIKVGHDYAVPSQTALQFDAKPGVEDVAMIFSRTRLEADQYLDPKLLTCYVSSHQDGAKDLVPTRMQLSWDDPDPVIIPQDMLKPGAPQVVSFSGAANVKFSVDNSRTELHASVQRDKSSVYVVNEKPDSILALEVALQHE